MLAAQGFAVVCTVVLAQDAPCGHACLAAQLKQDQLEPAVESVQVAERAATVAKARPDGVETSFEELVTKTASAVVL